MTTENNRYEPPEVVDLGPVEDLTQGVDGGPADSGEGATNPVAL
jgi:hypothetical protein